MSVEPPDFYLDELAFGYTALQAGASFLETQSYQLLALIDRVRSAAVIADLAAMAWGWGTLAMELNRRYAIIPYVESLRWYDVAALVGAAAAFIAFSIYAVKAINRYFRPEESQKIQDVNSRYSDVRVAYDRPQAEKGRQWLYIARIVANIGLAVFGISPYAAFNTVCLAYSLYKISQQRWLKVERDIPYPYGTPEGTYWGIYASARDSVKSATYTYFFLILPSQNGDVYACPKHTVSEEKIIDAILIKDDPLQGSYATKRVYVDSRSGAQVFYDIEIPERNLVHCSECDHAPVRSFIEVSVQDQSYGWKSASITLISE